MLAELDRCSLQYHVWSMNTLIISLQGISRNAKLQVTAFFNI